MKHSFYSETAGLTQTNRNQILNMVDILRERACLHPEQKAVLFLENRCRREVALTYAELDLTARAIAAWLQARASAGDRVLLLYPPGLDYISAFFGCLYAGMVAVPLYPPHANQKLFRASAVVRDCDAGFVLTVSKTEPLIRAFFDNDAQLGSLTVCSTNEIGAAGAESYRPVALSASQVAFLQYTSGSTGTPKGVMVSHGSLIANEAAITRSFATSERDICLNWLPFYHDMGLIGAVLQPLYRGFLSILMPPLAFAQNPFLWLRAIDRYQATIAGAPNFAYQLLVDKATPEQLAGLDLSSWRIAFNGSEPISPGTLHRFSETFSSRGFQASAHSPCYGMAEATLFITGSRRDSEVVTRRFDAEALRRDRAEIAGPAGEARELCSSGCVVADHQLLIRDAAGGQPLADGLIGEILFSGPSVAMGYWGQETLTRETFDFQSIGHEARFLRTGDLGFLHQGQLYVTGRIKDLVIIRGRNHYPQDIERTIEACHPAMRADCAAAFSISLDAEEVLIIVGEVERRAARGLDPDEAITTIRAAVAEQHELQVHTVVLIKHGGLPKTSSGKVQRHAARDLYLDGALTVLANSMIAPEQMPRPLVLPDRESLLMADDPAAEMLACLRDLAASTLGLDPVDMDGDTSLTELGLDSMKAIHLQHRLQQELAADLPIAAVLQGKPLRRLAELALERMREQEPPPPRTPGTRLPLTVNQRALWFLHRLEPENTVYNLSYAVELHAGSGPEALRDAFARLAVRHGALRTVYSEHEGEPYQLLKVEVGLHFHLVEAGAFSEAELDAAIGKRARQPFDLSAAPPWAVHYYRRTERSVLQITTHHISFDFWSLQILLDELTAHGGEARPLPQADVAHFAEAQGTMLDSPRGEVLWNYWRQKLADAPTVLELPADRTRPAAVSYRGASVPFRLDSALTNRFEALARERGATLSSALMAAFQALLARYSGREDFLVGTPLSGRDSAAYSETIGYFVNMVPLRADLSNQPCYGDLLARTHHDMTEALAHGDFPFQLLVERLQLERVPSRSPLFQVAFAMQASYRLPGAAALAVERDGATLNLGRFALAARVVPRDTAQFDLTLFAAHESDGLTFSLEFSTDLFERARIERMAAHFQRLVAEITAAPEQPLADIDILSLHERGQLRDWSRLPNNYRRDQTLDRMFAAAVETRPHAAAVVQGVRVLTYGELSRRAQTLAAELAARGANGAIGVMAEQGGELLIALLAVSSAGAAFVPLDPNLPDDRLRFLLDDCRMDILIHQPRFADRVAALSTMGPPLAGTVCLNEPLFASARGFVARSQPEGEAYVIYTSGSTGKPKGVPIAHREITPLFDWSRDFFQLSEQTRALQSLNHAFDYGIYEIFAPLLFGGTLFVPAPADRGLADRFATCINDYRINAIHATPSFFSQVVVNRPKLPTLKHLTMGAEVVERDLVQALFASVSQTCTVYNAYGPTEASVITATFPIGKPGAPVPALAAPIGGPVADKVLHVLDRNGRTSPPGIIGELCIGGSGISRGYLHLPALSAEKFVPDPFAQTPGQRLYRSGDLVTFRQDGNLVFLGRIDHQVKIRGFRIEPGEIAATLRDHEDVNVAAVICRHDPEPRLVAFLVADPALKPAIREYLRERLPSYMMPSAFVFLESLPMTPNGKLDLAALPITEPEQAGDDLSLPETASERVVAEIWCDLFHLEQVGRNADFFELGGHSLLATRFTSRIQAHFGVTLPISSLFTMSSLVRLAAEIDTLLKTGGENRPPLLRGDDPGPHPLSFAQRRMWFLDQFETDISAYHIPMAVRLRGSLDVAALEASFNQIVARHDSLRTCIREYEGQPKQVVVPFSPLVMPLADLAAAKVEVADLARTEALAPFDLKRGPLFRLRLLRLNANEHVLLWNTHHIVSDGWSIGVLMHELSVLYPAFRQALPCPLPTLRIQYTDYALWQRSWLQGEVLEEKVAYWRRQLEKAPTLLELPTDRPRPSRQSFRGALLHFQVDQGVTRGLERLSAENGATMFMTLIGAFATLLHRFTGARDLVIGSPVANRSHPDVEALIGFFANMLPLRFDLSGNPAFSDLLERVADTSLAAFEHEDVPFEQLVEELQPERDLSYSPLFQVAFAQLNAPLEERCLANLALEPLMATTTTAKFDLTLSLEERDNLLLGILEYNTDLFDERRMRHLAEHYDHLLCQLVAVPSRRLADFEMVHPTERARLLAWSGLQREFAGHHSVDSLFAMQTTQTPDKVAVAQGDQQLTFGELARQASALSQRLLPMSGPNRVIGVLSEQGPDLLVAVLGTLMSGAAFVPLDPKLPEKRLAWLINDSCAETVLLQPALAEKLAGVSALDSPLAHTVPIVRLEDNREEVASRGEMAHLAYVIYTSGSTGRPKGVPIAHRELTGLFHWSRQRFCLSLQTRSLQSLNHAFDYGVFEMLAPLLFGGTLFVPEIADRGLPDPFAGTIQARYINQLHVTPSFFGLVVASSQNLGSLRHLALGGEAVERELVRAIFASIHPDCVLYNAYGPTEASIISSTAVVERPDKTELPYSISIGGPVADKQLFILDKNGRLAPLGIWGELNVGGPGLSRGYLNRPALSAAFFTPNPFALAPGGRLYRTGDLVRFDSQGQIQFLGRLDHQVKIRGFRIEPGEIAGVIRDFDGVSAAVVICRTDPEKRLVAYLAAEPDLKAPLTSYLHERLPSYMIPSAFVFLDALPMTPNGKLDPRALPDPERVGEAEVAEAPQTATERVVAAIWRELLHLDRIDRSAHFFELGGHSLLATRFISRIQAHYGVNLPLASVFTTGRLDGLAREIESLRKQGDGRPDLIHLNETGPYGLSFSQQRLWFIYQMDPDSTVFNLPFTLRLRGCLDVSALEKALAEIVSRHEVLRTHFAETDTGPVQVIEPVGDFRPEFLDLRDLPQEERPAAAAALALERAERPFDLEQGAAAAWTLIQIDETVSHLLLVMHHIITDGRSIEIIAGELKALYGAYREGHPSPLAKPEFTYRDFTHWQRDVLDQNRVDELMYYWRYRLQGAPTLLVLPYDRPRPKRQTFTGHILAQALDGHLIENLTQLGSQEGASMFMTGLTAYQILLAKLSGQNDIVTGSDIANRQNGQLDGLIGFFVNQLILRADLSGDPSFRELLVQTRETVLEDYAHQDIPFERLVDGLQPERSLEHSPIFQVKFLLQYLPDDELNLPGLEIDSVEVAHTPSQYDLIFSVDFERGRACWLRAYYNIDLFDEGTIGRFLGYYQTLLEAMTSNPGQRISTVALLNGDERRLVLEEWNKSEAPRGPARFAQMLEQRAARQPNKQAVVCDEGQLTYAELNKRANQLASHLRDVGVGPDMVVAVFSERCPELVVAIVGIIKAGGAFLPLDPNYPEDRIEYMLEDSAASVLLTTEAMEERLPLFYGLTVVLDPDYELIDHESEDNPRVLSTDENLMYVLYTSGSTGQPKASQVKIASFYNLCCWYKDFCPIDSESNVLLVIPISFDASIKNLWVPLISGARLVLFNDGPFDPAKLLANIERYQVHVMNGVPSMGYPLAALAAADNYKGLESLRLVAMGGEPTDMDKLRAWLSAPNCNCIYANIYGPTECTDISIAYKLPKQKVAACTRLPIGAPIDNARPYIVDANLRLTPPGVPGELVIAGRGLARGYLNQPGLSAERYLPNPFGRGRLYRTGDLARWLPEKGPAGALGAAAIVEYLGRVDEQIKIRGMRIELGEIEEALRHHVSIRDAVVVVREEETTGRRLAAFLVITSGELPPTPGELRKHLSHGLPEYMVPAFFAFVEKIPLSPNGKIDRLQLARSRQQFEVEEEVYEEPRTAQEKLVAEVFSEVLGVERVGLGDNFFQLGGDSILSIQIVSAVQKRAMNVSVDQIFQFPTVGDLARKIVNPPVTEGQNERQDSEPFCLIAQSDRAKLPADVVDAYPLGRLQAGMLYHTELQPDEAIYHDVFSIHLRYAFDSDLFRAAAQQVFDRHPVLRTGFDLSHFNEPLQLVYRQVDVVVNEADFRDFPEELHEEMVTERFELLKQQSFDWRKPPLMRFHLYRRSEESFHIHIEVHHAILDGWSMATLLTELFESYREGLETGRIPQLGAPPTNYRDFIAAERAALACEDHRAFWENTLVGATYSDFPSWRERPDAAPHAIAFHSVSLDKQVLNDLEALAKKEHLPLKSILLAAHIFVMRFLTAKADVVTGVVCNGRLEVSGGEKTLGLFLNTLPFRLGSMEDQSWLALMRNVLAAESRYMTYRRYPLSELIRRQGNPLFDTLFNYNDFHVYQGLGSDLSQVLEGEGYEFTNFTYQVSFARDISAGLGLSLDYDPGKVSPLQIETAARCFQRVLASMAREPDRIASSLNLFNERELAKLDTWSRASDGYTVREGPADNIYDMFAAVAAASEHQIAVQAGEEQLTYAELKVAADHLAHRLQAMGVGPETTVGLHMTRCPEMVIGMFAILAAGGAFVPMDPDYPEQRLELMASDACISVLLTRKDLNSDFVSAAVEKLYLEPGSVLPGSAPICAAHGQSSAYIIYTSGSTGKPKGVVISQRALLTFIRTNIAEYKIRPEDCFLQFASISFDTAMEDIFTSLLGGCRLALRDDEMLVSCADFYARCRQWNISIMNIPTAFWHGLVQDSNDALTLPDSIRLVGIGGERAQAAFMDIWQKQVCNKSGLINIYGPTEATVSSTFWYAEPGANSPREVPIGRALAHTRIYVLDPKLRLTSIGVRGELHIGGAALARGYLNLPGLTAQKFVPDPFSRVAGARLYKSGDLCCFQPDDNAHELQNATLLFMGRVDFQFKLRGFRIEPGEIEAALVAHPLVKEAVVVLSKVSTQDIRLVGYVSLDVDHADYRELGSEDLRHFLRDQLPEHMVPAKIMILQALPLSPSRKLDRGALPSPEWGTREKTLIAPKNETEKELARIWCQVLDLDEISSDDDFFDIGGHSLTATVAMSRIKETFRVAIPLARLFKSPTISDLAEIIQTLQWAGQGAPEKEEPAADEEEFRL